MTLDRSQIVEIAKRRGEFRVDRYLWRFDKLRRKCRKLSKDGRLRFVGVDGREIVYGPGEEGQDK